MRDMSQSQTSPSTFKWPGGKRAAVSITFDDAQPSQVDSAVPVLESHGQRGSFYVTIKAVPQRLDAWKRAIANGHEVGNHSISHPCTGNFPFSRRNALEDFTLDKMDGELAGASQQIEQMLGITPTTFAYPCGQTFVGRGTNLKSYIPLVAKRFIAGRAFNNETPNDPEFCDLAHLMGIGFDARPFDWVRPHIDAAIERGHWLILVGHCVGVPNMSLNVEVSELEAVCRYCREKSNEIWTDTVHNIASHIRKSRPA
jgi:peptidoglycan/xylan/chitin deacetylase (PgdA/CDA1 family)